MKECRIIAIANHKGGVGKTTTTKELGSILARKGHKVLLIDLDAQANLTASLSTVMDGPGIYDLMTGKTDRLPVIGINECLDLVPASLSLAMVDVELSSAIARERILSDVIEKSHARQEYDFIILDCPPSLGLMTLNAFTAKYVFAVFHFFVTLPGFYSFKFIRQAYPEFFSLPVPCRVVRQKLGLFYAGFLIQICYRFQIFICIRYVRYKRRPRQERNPHLCRIPHQFPEVLQYDIVVYTAVLLMCFPVDDLHIHVDARHERQKSFAHFIIIEHA